MKIKSYNTDILIIIVFCFFQKLLIAQERSWICVDEVYKSKFMELYMDLEEDTETEDFGISEDNDLVIYLKVERLDKITAIHYDGLGRDLRLDLLSDDLRKGLKKRKYKWNNIDPSKSKYRTRGRNVFDFVDSKNVRDYYWWIRNTATWNVFNSNLSARPDKSPLAVIIKKGEEEIGFPNNLSNTSRIFLSTEPTRFFINLPISLPYISYGTPHPLEQTVGGGMSFDIGSIGGMLSYNSIDNLSYSDAHNPNNTVFNQLSGIFYWNFSSKVGSDFSPEFTKSVEKKGRMNPKGTQRITVGGVYSNLVYGKIDSLNNFTSLYTSDLKNSLNVLIGWAYVSTPKNFGTDVLYSKVKINSKIFLGSQSKASVSFLYGIKKWISLGLNISGVERKTFLENQNNEYSWKPGYFISPNLIVRF